jgi:hypothetical protein
LKDQCDYLKKKIHDIKKIFFLPDDDEKAIENLEQQLYATTQIIKGLPLDLKTVDVYTELLKDKTRTHQALTSLLTLQEEQKQCIEELRKFFHQ